MAYNCITQQNKCITVLRATITAFLADSKQVHWIKLTVQNGQLPVQSLQQWH